MKDSKIDNKFIDSNNFTEKPLYTTKANTESYNIEISYNPFQKKSKNTTINQIIQKKNKNTTINQLMNYLLIVYSLANIAKRWKIYRIYI